MDKISDAQLSKDELPEGFTFGGTPSNEGSTGDEARQQQRSMILEQACTKEALARLGRIRMVKESRAKAIEDSIVAMALQGRLPGRIDEAKLIQILEGDSQSRSKRSEGSSKISIQRKRYDSDSDDDDDDI